MAVPVFSTHAIAVTANVPSEHLIVPVWVLEVGLQEVPFQTVNAGQIGFAAPAVVPVVGAHQVPFQEVLGPQPPTGAVTVGFGPPLFSQEI